MPIVTISIFEGRSVDQKRRLVEGVTDVVCDVTGNTAESVNVIIEEKSRENWGIGRQLAIDRQAKPQN
jgi:4-oxalocrotonate tautomerase